MGFVAVFGGAANTPIAATFMGIELFGIESGVFIAIACVMSYLASGNNGIYSSQRNDYGKYHFMPRKEVVISKKESSNLAIDTEETGEIKNSDE